MRLRVRLLRLFIRPLHGHTRRRYLQAYRPKRRATAIALKAE